MRWSELTIPREVISLQRGKLVGRLTLRVQILAVRRKRCSSGEGGSVGRFFAVAGFLSLRRAVRNIGGNDSIHIGGKQPNVHMAVNVEHGEFRGGLPHK
jgi:hypothetical protein